MLTDVGNYVRKSGSEIAITPNVTWIWSAPHQDHYYVTYNENSETVPGT
jgi:hypothetical protein